MNLRQASPKDRQREAWTKVPEDVAAAIGAWAKEQNITAYEGVRRLLYCGMLAATAANDWRRKKSETGTMTEKTYKQFIRLCEREMNWAEHGIKPVGHAAEVLEEAKDSPPWEA